MLPRTFDEWNIDAIRHLLIQGYYEAETFDFKEMLPHKNGEDDKLRLIKTCCAFANSSGGFLIFGVKDGKSGGTAESRLVGINPTFDLPEQFGNYPHKCTPSVEWNFKNPPIQLENGNVIHIVHIPRSWNATHCFEMQGKGSDKQRCFIKRTNKGNEDMSYEEIRMAFLQYYEKRLKLQLLKSELENTRWHAKEELIVSESRSTVQFGKGEFSLTVIETVLADTYTILAGYEDLLKSLFEIRNRCRVVNDLLRIFYQVATIGWAGNNVEPHPAIERHNKNVEDECKPIVMACTRALALLEEVMAQ